MQLIIISGRSGSGKSTALNQLEDEGFYCIDNLPISLLPALIEKIGGDEFSFFQGIAVCIDARNAWKDLWKIQSDYSLTSTIGGNPNTVSGRPGN